MQYLWLWRLRPETLFLFADLSSQSLFTNQLFSSGAFVLAMNHHRLVLNITLPRNSANGGSNEAVQRTYQFGPYKFTVCATPPRVGEHFGSLQIDFPAQLDVTQATYIFNNQAAAAMTVNNVANGQTIHYPSLHDLDDQLVQGAVINVTIDINLNVVAPVLFNFP